MTKKSITKLFILLAVYTSCSGVREELSELPACIPLKPDTAYHIQDRAFVDMMISDSLLIFIASKDSNLFSYL